MDHKIESFDRAVDIIRAQREAGRKIVLCHGVFDLLHIGHIRYLRGAKKYGDFLVVTITPDIHVDKGPGRPAFTERLRAEALSSLDFVDLVAVNRWPTAENTLQAIRPDFYAKGAEYRDPAGDSAEKFAPEAAAAREIGTELVFVEDLVFSSSNLINTHFQIYPAELSQYLELLRKRYDLADICAALDRLETLKILVVGDPVIDQYAYCRTLGASLKGPTLALRQLSGDCHPGGALSVARHAANLTAKAEIHIVSSPDQGPLDLARHHLPANLKLDIVPDPAYAPVRRLRYLDDYYLSNALEVHHIAAERPGGEAAEELRRRLENTAGAFDLVLISDSGLGVMDEPLIELLSEQAKFLALNIQASHDPRSHRSVWRYRRADFVSLGLQEIGQAFSGRAEPPAELRSLLSPGLLIMTAGAGGLEIFKDNGHLKTPALASRVVDRVGAGEALFTAAALAAYLGLPAEIIGLIGNIAGGRMVESVGNDINLDRSFFKRALTAMLK